MCGKRHKKDTTFCNKMLHLSSFKISYMFGQTTAFCRFPDNAVCLRAREGTGFIASAGKQKIMRRGFGAEAPVGVKRLMQDGVDGNRSCFFCFLFQNTDIKNMSISALAAYIGDWKAGDDGKLTSDNSSYDA